jgi:carbamoyltransferase
MRFRPHSVAASAATSPARANGVGRPVQRELTAGIWTGRNAAVAMLDGGRLVAAVEEEKLTRARSRPAFPERALRFCLQEAGASLDDLSVIAVASHPRRAWIREQLVRARWLMWPTRRGLGSASRLRDCFSAFNELGHATDLDLRLDWFDHHRCHAASAYYPSPFDRAAVLTLDGGGDMQAGTAWLGLGSALTQVWSADLPHSLGWLYSRVTEALGYRPGRDESRVQWLGSYGSREFLPVFRQIAAHAGDDGFPLFAPRSIVACDDGWTLSSTFLDALGIPRSGPLLDRSRATAIASSLQAFVEESVVELAERLRRRTRADALCVAGGLFLNALLVRALEERTSFRRVFVQPAAGNAGTALGAACLAVAGKDSERTKRPVGAGYPGPRYDSTQIKEVLDNCKLVYQYIDVEPRLLACTTALLQQGRSVAWFQDRLEFGLRALGNRSILASPFSPYVAENLNRYIKHRDEFHPFLLSVPLAQFVVGGQYVRVHTVEERTNGLFWRLLHAFGEHAPAPVLVNTSFNLFGEPLVADPRDAVRSFYGAGIDAMVIGSFLIQK